MMMLICSMAPQIIIISDEIGTKEDGIAVLSKKIPAWVCFIWPMAVI